MNKILRGRRMDWTMRDAATQALAMVIMLWGLTTCASPEEIRAGDAAACSGYGFQPNTPDFAACLQRESQARQYTPPPTAGYGPGWYGPGWYGPGWYRW
jgi:hypothetical protein